MTQIILSDEEMKIIAANKREGETVESTMSRLASDGLARRVKKNMRRNPANNVMKFRGRG